MELKKKYFTTAVAFLTLSETWARGAQSDALRSLEPKLGELSEADQARTRRTDWVKNLPAGVVDGFFVDDSSPRLATAQACWDLKLHRRLAGDLVPARTRSVRSLIVFRRNVGTFPTSPKQRVDLLYPPSKEAFAEAWGPFREDHPKNLEYVAWTAFDRIQRGHFVDDDSSLVRSAAMSSNDDQSDAN